MVNEITTSSEDAAIVTAIIRMAHSLNLEVIGEGIETKEQMHFLKEQECDEFQGYLFTQAIEPDLYKDWAQDWRNNRISEYEFDKWYAVNGVERSGNKHQSLLRP